MRCRPISRLTAVAVCSLSRAPALLAQAPPVPVVAITNVTTIDVAAGTRMRGQTVVVRGERILRVGPADRVAIPRSASRVDGRGKFLIPGLWDMHVHAMQSTDTARQQRVFDLFLANGVTGFRDMGSHLDTLRAIRAQIAAGRYVMTPRIVAAGPLLDGPKFRWSQSVAWHMTNAAEARQAVDSLRRVEVDFLKVYGSLPRDAYFAIAAAAKENGLSFAGHIPLSVTSAEAVAAGQRSIEHNGMDITDVCVDSARTRIDRALTRWVREGYAAWYSERLAYAGLRDPVRCAAHAKQMRERGTFLVPTIVLELRDRRALTTTAFQYLDSLGRVACEGTVAGIMSAPDSVRSRFFDGFLRDVREQHAAGISLLAGSDLSNACLVPGFSLHDELAALVQAGLTPREALAAATTGPAAYLRRSETSGRIATGHVADLVLLDADPIRDINNVRRIRAVIATGRVLDRAALDRMLARRP